MEVTLIRHFPTPGNRQRKYIGRTDESLCPDYHNEFDYPAVERVIASPMKRCIETAGLVYPGQEPVLCRQLQECDFGLFEGKSYEQLKDLPLYQQWLESAGTLKFPGGEDPADFRQRCVDGFREVVDRLIAEQCRRAALIVHGGTIMAILSAYDPEESGFYHWQVENGSGFTVTLAETDWLEKARIFTEIKRL